MTTILSTPDAAKILGLSVRQLYRLLAARVIPEPRRIGTTRHAWTPSNVAKAIVAIQHRTK